MFQVSLRENGLVGVIEMEIQSPRDEVEVAPIYLPVLSSRPSAPSSNLSSDFVSPPLHLVPTERYYLRPRWYVLSMSSLPSQYSTALSNAWKT